MITRQHNYDKYFLVDIQLVFNEIMISFPSNNIKNYIPILMKWNTETGSFEATWRKRIEHWTFRWMIKNGYAFRDRKSAQKQEFMLF